MKKTIAKARVWDLGRGWHVGLADSNGFWTLGLLYQLEAVFDLTWHIDRRGFSVSVLWGKGARIP